MKIKIRGLFSKKALLIVMFSGFGLWSLIQISESVLLMLIDRKFSKLEELGYVVSGKEYLKPGDKENNLWTSPAIVRFLDEENITTDEFFEKTRILGTSTGIGVKQINFIDKSLNGSNAEIIKYLISDLIKVEDGYSLGNFNNSNKSASEITDGKGSFQRVLRSYSAWLLKNEKEIAAVKSSFYDAENIKLPLSRPLYNGGHLVIAKNICLLGLKNIIINLFGDENKSVKDDFLNILKICDAAFKSEPDSLGLQLKLVMLESWSNYLAFSLQFHPFSEEDLDELIKRLSIIEFLNDLVLVSKTDATVSKIILTNRKYLGMYIGLEGDIPKHEWLVALKYINDVSDLNFLSIPNVNKVFKEYKSVNKFSENEFKLWPPNSDVEGLRYFETNVLDTSISDLSLKVKMDFLPENFPSSNEWSNIFYVFDHAAKMENVLERVYVVENRIILMGIALSLEKIYLKTGAYPDSCEDILAVYPFLLSDRVCVYKKISSDSYLLELVHKRHAEIDQIVNDLTKQLEDCQKFLSDELALKSGYELYNNEFEQKRNTLNKIPEWIQDLQNWRDKDPHFFRLYLDSNLKNKNFDYITEKSNYVRYKFVDF